MKVTRIVAFAVIAASIGVGGLHAQNLRNAQTPAEFPPASYTGAQYVDSKGCVYIRAGIDGNVTWIPRVNRQRRLICGQTPTLSAAAAQAARTTPRQSANTSAVEQITVPTQAAPAPRTTTVATPQPASRPVAPVRTAAPVPRRVETVRRPTPVVTAPTATKAPVRRTTTTAAVKQHKPACPGASAISGRYIRSGDNTSVRCGPQPVTRTEASVAPTEQAIGLETRVMPRHVYDARLTEQVNAVPEGYRAVWDDDRLNPRRAEQNLAGIARTRLVWTRTVPRRLIDQATGQDVTTRVPLVYPYTDQATQARELGTVTLVHRDGQLMKRIVRNKAKTRKSAVPVRAATAPEAPSKAKAKATAPATARYVQVGMFGVPANAKAAAQRILRAGLPARIGKLTRGGKSYQVVLAGPFASTSDLRTGLKRSRSAGFSDAFVRN